MERCCSARERAEVAGTSMPLPSYLVTERGSTHPIAVIRLAV